MKKFTSLISKRKLYAILALVLLAIGLSIGAWNLGMQVDGKELDKAWTLYENTINRRQKVLKGFGDYVQTNFPDEKLLLDTIKKAWRLHQHSYDLYEVLIDDKVNQQFSNNQQQANKIIGEIIKYCQAKPSLVGDPGLKQNLSSLYFSNIQLQNAQRELNRRIINFNRGFRGPIRKTINTLFFDYQPKHPIEQPD